MVLTALGIVLILIALSDAFETIVLPRTVKRTWRLTSIFFRGGAKLHRLYGKIRRDVLRQGLLVSYAPLMLIALIAIWAILMILGFALVSLGAAFPLADPKGIPSIGSYVYHSGVTFFTLGYGDVVARSAGGRAVSVLEAGTGFGFLALVIAYVPVLYSAFSRREVRLLLLDSKAGSDPTASEVLSRYAEANCLHILRELLRDWEQGAAELMESYLSYPILAYYRSQHDHQSWLRSLVAIMDVCALVETRLAGDQEWLAPLRMQARSTFAMARHLIVDLAYVLDTEPVRAADPRFTPERLASITDRLSAQGVECLTSPESVDELVRTIELYEPYVEGLSRALLMPLPNWIPPHHELDNWQTSAWDGQHF